MHEYWVENRSRSAIKACRCRCFSGPVARSDMCCATSVCRSVAFAASKPPGIGRPVSGPQPTPMRLALSASGTWQPVRLASRGSSGSAPFVTADQVYAYGAASAAFNHVPGFCSDALCFLRRSLSWCIASRRRHRTPRAGVCPDSPGHGGRFCAVPFITLLSWGSKWSGDAARRAHASSLRQAARAGAFPARASDFSPT